MKIRLVGGSKHDWEYDVPDDTLHLQFKWLQNTDAYVKKIKELNVKEGSDLSNNIMDKFSEVIDTYTIAEFDEENNIQLFRVDK